MMPGMMPGMPGMPGMTPPGMPGMAPLQKGGGSSSQAQPKAPPDDDGTIDDDVKELGDYFNIEDRWVKRLNESMKKRQATKEADLAKLYEVLENARSPTGLLTVK